MKIIILGYDRGIDFFIISLKREPASTSAASGSGGGGNDCHRCQECQNNFPTISFENRYFYEGHPTHALSETQAVKVVFRIFCH
jgi:hypothetical protein